LAGSTKGKFDRGGYTEEPQLVEASQSGGMEGKSGKERREKADLLSRRGRVPKRQLGTISNLLRKAGKNVKTRQGGKKISPV